MNFNSKLSALVLLGLMAGAANAEITWGNIQWPEVGMSVSNGSDVTVYSKVFKDGCTGVCDPEIVPCADIDPTIFFREEGGAWQSAAMTFNTGDCYSPNEEYSGIIPMAVLTGATVDFYIEYHDLEDDTYFYPGDYDGAAPAWYDIDDATTAEFTYHVCVDMHCVPSMAPGFSGSFNGWTNEPLTETPVDSDIWCGDIVVPIGSNPVIEFKFRNGGGWEDSIPNRTYAIAPGATFAEDDYLWDDTECSGPTELLDDLMVIFTLDMEHQDPALYAGGVSIQGGSAPLGWVPGAELMTYHPEEDNFTIAITFPVGTSTNLAYKFTRSADGVAFDWESIDNRPLFLDELLGPTMIAPTNFWNEFIPPTITTVDIEVVFQLNMACLDAEAYAFGASIQGDASPFDWDAGSTLMMDSGDGDFDVVVIFPAGTAVSSGYKYTHSADGEAWAWEDAIGNRTLELDDSMPYMTIDFVKWEDYDCPPAVSIEADGADFILNWIPEEAQYNVYFSENAYEGDFTLIAQEVFPPYTVSPAGAKGFYFVTKVIYDDGGGED
jgi:hypothetical protein